jgi:hypothetical protein
MQLNQKRLLPPTAVLNDGNGSKMPTMSYEIVSQTNNQYGNPYDAIIDIYADDKKVATVDNNTIWPMGDVIFFAGDNEEVFFTIQQNGLGDTSSSNTNAYELDLSTGAKQQIRFAPSALVSSTFFISNVRTSPDGYKMAVAVETPIPGQYGGIGPWQVWIVDLQNQEATLYQRGGAASSQWIRLTGWLDDSTPLWQYAN